MKNHIFENHKENKINYGDEKNKFIISLCVIFEFSEVIVALCLVQY